MQLDADIQRCVDTCLSCHSRCLSTAMLHCLEAGGKHTEPQHFRLMMACAEICRTAAYFMMIGSAHHPHLCRECAEICSECATDCERIGEMADCADICRRCAETCRQMAV